ncbi:MAG: cytochrome c3 family protein, partial [Desulfatibacillaceae bacterium]|nr:cytochrome c3 family protein [Desulfatibacillaceae bacterium]
LFILIALAFFIGNMGAGRALDNGPKLLATAPGGDCAACHDQEVLFEEHPPTAEMGLDQCLECHAGDEPRLENRLPLSHTHLLAGISCGDCHEDPDSPMFVEKETCMACHARQDILQATKETKPVNPHDSHYGPDLGCDLCHLVHRPSENFCNQCHEYDFVIPSPIIKGGTMSEKELYQQKMQAKLDELKADVDKLRARARGAEADAKIKAHEQIDELEKRIEKGKTKLDELGKASQDAWTSLKKGIDEAVTSLGTAIKDAYNKFK